MLTLLSRSFFVYVACRMPHRIPRQATGGPRMKLARLAPSGGRWKGLVCHKGMLPSSAPFAKRFMIKQVVAEEMTV